MPITRRKRTDESGQGDEDEREELFRRKLAKKHGTEPLPSLPKQATNSEATAPSTPTKDPGGVESSKTISEAGIWVNRAPVLTLWVTLVAQRQGFSRDTGLTCGKLIAGMMAQAKGQRIGVYHEQEPHGGSEATANKAELEERAGVRKVEVFGMHVRAVEDKGRLLAVDSNLKPYDPRKVDDYLHKAFGARLADAEHALGALAASYSPEEIGKESYRLYTEFRPGIPDGQAGWGRKGLLDLLALRSLYGQ